MIFLELGYLGTILSLTIKSAFADGFMTVNYTAITHVSDVFSERIWESQFRWTLAPGVLTALFSIGYAGLVTATAQRQPYVEIYRPLKHNKSRRSAKLTLLLDYPSQAIFYSWYIALQNRHFVLGAGILLQLLASIFIVPLSNNLFRTKATSHASPTEVYSISALDTSRLRLSTDLQPALDVTSAVHAYNAAPPTWMTRDTAIRPFLQIEPSRQGNFSVDTSVYAAKLDCKLIPRDEISINPASASDGNVGDVLVEFIDRECDVINQGFQISSETPQYAITWTQACFGTDSSKDRIGVFVASYSETDSEHLGDLVTVSCIPSYFGYNTSVLLQFEALTAPEIISIDRSKERRMVSDNFRALHSSLPLYQTYDASNTFRSDAFAKSVYTTASNIEDSTTSHAMAVMKATRSLYSTLFAALIVTQLMPNFAEAQKLDAEFFQLRTRLYVVDPVAYIMVALLCMMTGVTVAICYLAIAFKTGLTEEPVGLLGRVVILLRSELLPWLENLRSEQRESHGVGEKLVTTIEEEFTVETSECWAQHESGDPELVDAEVVHISGLVRNKNQKPKLLIRIKAVCLKFWNILLTPARKLADAWNKWRKNAKVRKLRKGEKEAAKRSKRGEAV
jgi:hypothetical protein